MSMVSTMTQPNPLRALVVVRSLRDDGEYASQTDFSDKVPETMWPRLAPLNARVVESAVLVVESRHAPREAELAQYDCIIISPDAAVHFGRRCRDLDDWLAEHTWPRLKTRGWAWVGDRLIRPHLVQLGGPPSRGGAASFSGFSIGGGPTVIAKGPPAVGASLPAIPPVPKKLPIGHEVNWRGIRSTVNFHPRPGFVNLDVCDRGVTNHVNMVPITELSEPTEFKLNDLVVWGNNSGIYEVIAMQGRPAGGPRYSIAKRHNRTIGTAFTDIPWDELTLVASADAPNGTTVPMGVSRVLVSAPVASVVTTR